MIVRSFKLGRATQDSGQSGDLVVDMALASEEPCERWWGTEVLDCSADAVRLTRANDGAPILYNHDRDDLRGVHVPGSVRCEVHKVRGQARITSATQKGREAIELVKSRVLTKASVGYQVHRVVEVATTKDGRRIERSIDGWVFERALALRGITRDGVHRGDGNVGAFRRSLDEIAGTIARVAGAVPTYVVIDWEPLESSLVTIPADNTVGVGRSAVRVTRRPNGPGHRHWGLV